MVVLVLGTDISEELMEGSSHPGVDVIGGEIKPCCCHSLEELILGWVILESDVMGACLNMNICCPGGEDLVVFLDVVYLGYPEGILLGVGVEATGESDIVHCRSGCLVHLLNEGVDRGIDIGPDHTGVIVSSGDSDLVNHLTTLL